MKHYDVIVVGAGPGGIFTAYELMRLAPGMRVAVFEAGNPLEKRKCPIDGDRIKTCVHCPTCAIMNGFGGAGAFSDGKYNITNEFGGSLHEYIGKQKAVELMRYVDEINMAYGGEGTKLYTTANSHIKKALSRKQAAPFRGVGAASRHGQELRRAAESVCAPSGQGRFLFPHAGHARGKAGGRLCGRYRK